MEDSAIIMQLLFMLKIIPLQLKALMEPLTLMILLK